MNWESQAAKLASQVTEPSSRWRALVAAVPRHEFVPRWWSADATGWTLQDSPAMPSHEWAEAVYRDVSLVTRIGTLHADQAEKQDRPDGRPTSSSTMPGLVVSMYRHAMIGDGMDVLDVGTGSGYGAALLATRLGDARVTTIDIDPCLVQAAEERLARAGLRPVAAVADALPGPTWVNRFFVHGASSAGLDHSPTQAQMVGWEAPGLGFTYPHGTIFDAVSRAGLTWRIYNDDTDAHSDDPQDGSVFGAIPQVSVSSDRRQRRRGQPRTVAGTPAAGPVRRASVPQRGRLWPDR
jgi:protein-L-isoaspartate O-methyltransferase